MNLAAVKFYVVFENVNGFCEFSEHIQKVTFLIIEVLCDTLTVFFYGILVFFSPLYFLILKYFFQFL